LKDLLTTVIPLFVGSCSQFRTRIELLERYRNSIKVDTGQRSGSKSSFFLSELVSNGVETVVRLGCRVTLYSIDNSDPQLRPGTSAHQLVNGARLGFVSRSRLHLDEAPDEFSPKVSSILDRSVGLSLD